LVFGGADDDELDASGFDPDLGLLPSGADLLSGGPGNDRVHYWPRTAGVRVTLDGVANDGGAGEGDNVGGPANDVENVDGGFGNDLIVGNGVANELNGLDGTDLIFGLAAGDHLIGGPSRDVLDGGPGGDSFDADDNERDLVLGGAGLDSADVDRPGDGSPTFDLVVSVESLS
jgi:Ca2+-binding RTX toxin-like protein